MYGLHLSTPLFTMSFPSRPKIYTSVAKTVRQQFIQNQN